MNPASPQAGRSSGDDLGGQHRFHRRSVLSGLLVAELVFILLVTGGWMVARMQEAALTSTPPLATDFIWALDEGSERILYLEGGVLGQPTAVRIRDAGGTTLTSGETHGLDPVRNTGVCSGSPPRWPIWWTRTVPEAVADSLRRHDYQTFVFEGFVDGTWQRLRLTDSGCRHHGAG